MSKYMHQLKERLLDYEIEPHILNQILQQYQKRIDQNKPMEAVEYEVERLIQKYHLKLTEDHKRHLSSIISIAPLISVVLYLMLGFLFDLWHPGWLIFFLVPSVVLVFFVFRDDITMGFLAIIPFLIIISYFFVGFYFGLWHPTWLIFILLPMIGVFSRYRKRSIKFILFTISPFFTIGTYIILGSYFGLWGRIWVIFLLVPILACLEETNRKRLIICETTLLFSLIYGIVIPFVLPWGYSFIGLLVPIIALMSMGEESLIKFTKETIFDFILFMILAIVYIFIGVLFKGWAYGWMVLLIFPAYEIVNQSPNHFKFYYMTPFIAIIIFFSLGYFLSLWAYSWLAFIIIPINYLIERD